MDPFDKLRVHTEQSRSMDKNFTTRMLITQHLRIGLVGAWFGTAVSTLIFALILTIYLNTVQVIEPEGQNFRLYAALPATNSWLTQEIEIGDGRSKIIEAFFKKHKTPLAGYGDIFIQVADKYRLDYRLLPAISMQESNGGKKVIRDSKNPFGYGIYGSLILRFDSWELSIERVGRALREDYLDKGLKTPTQIMAKYTPPSLEKGGAWAKGVSSFMEELR